MWMKNPATAPPTAAASWSRWPSGYARAAMDGCGKPQPKTKRPLCRRIALRHSGFFATYGNDSDYIPCTIKLTRNSWIFSGCFFFYCTNRQKQRRQLRTQQRWKCLKKLSSCVLFTARSFVLFADLDEPQRFKNRIVLPRKVGRKEKDFVLYRPSLGRRVWMPAGGSELSGFQKRRRLKHTAS